MTLEYILRAAVRSMIHGHHAPHCYSAHVQGKGYIDRGDDPETRPEFLRQLERDATSEIENATYAPGYAEPGYSDPARGVVFADWNCLPRELDRILERAGYEIQWPDEWSTCDDCQKAVRTSPDSYSWRRSFYMPDDCTIVCETCAREDLDQYEEYLINNSDVADTFDIDWTSRGWTKFNPERYESGFHCGQDDQPSAIAETVPAGFDYLFALTTAQQFDMYFDCYIRAAEPQE